MINEDVAIKFTAKGPMIWTNENTVATAFIVTELNLTVHQVNRPNRGSSISWRFIGVGTAIAATTKKTIKHSRFAVRTLARLSNATLCTTVNVRSILTQADNQSE